MINMLVNASWRKVEGFAYGVDPFSYAYETSRAIPCYNEDGSYYYHEKQGSRSDATGQYVYNYNILNELENTSSVSNTRMWSATFNLQWDIVDGLEYQGLFSYNSSSVDTKTYATEHSFYITEMGIRCIMLTIIQTSCRQNGLTIPHKRYIMITTATASLV